MSDGCGESKSLHTVDVEVDEDDDEEPLSLSDTRVLLLVPSSPHFDVSTKMMSRWGD